ncbi:PREDICTED: ras-related protein Rab-21-like [Amphimedon queenslandica]|uniref:Ras-related protein Rab-21 n=1 Tax=Amphimedon queenslandica TaxID=400682 RepID=A0A1X7UVU6_AMPQE|nr:PREDICTED: ras-related protein Rab-21-like [Amphimedon queenslandica]XP_019851864.1 PREDICTED: ras-related protein Rab-21-like [Amphimedon queenslandica]XP_019851865.1 PREDICTED: ras-related protein Rab-21-like [Amphimedon queenslandica]|eukprot:XP_011403875.1 PREDICTED: ras-related protein Rab-21-like [Amphimedon queenslandica]
MAARTGGGGSLQVKVVLLGEGCVGKTSIVLRYVQNQFNDKHIQTLQASFLQKNLTINRRRLCLNIWDTAGQERYHALGPIYYRDSHAAIVVYDITDEDSFTKAKNWVRELRKMLGDSCVLVIVGNKSDLEKNKVIQEKDAQEYAASVGAKHFYTSAKQNKGIEEMFLDLSKRLLEKEGNNSNPSSTNPSSTRRPGGITVTDDSIRTDRPSGGGGGGGGGCCG